MDERGMLVERVGQPIKRIPRTPSKERVSELLGGRELTHGDALQLLEYPTIVRALTLAVLSPKVEFEIVLPWTRTVAEDLSDGKEVEAALLHLRSELL